MKGWMAAKRGNGNCIFALVLNCVNTIRGILNLRWIMVWGYRSIWSFFYFNNGITLIF